MKHPEAGLTVEWDVVIDQLRAQTRIGIHNHEGLSSRRGPDLGAHSAQVDPPADRARVGPELGRRFG